jgi:hypothetical protein
MYDEGYTSLGGVVDMVRDPKLRYTDEEYERVRYRPVYVLVADGRERLGGLNEWGPCLRYARVVAMGKRFVDPVVEAAGESRDAV